MQSDLVVVFDIGNVLLRWNPRTLYRKIFASEAELDAFQNSALSPEFLADTDRAQTLEPVIASRIALYPQYADALRAFGARWMETISGPVEENVTLLARLQALKKPVYAISNFCAETFEITCKTYPFLETFDGAVISGREGLIKPDRAIFDLFFARYKLHPQKTLFIDDSAKNIATAQALGMETIHFTDGVDVTAECYRRGLFS